MAAPKGNRFWEVRSSHGRKPVFPDSETLWKACCEYFDWNEENPLIEMKAFASAGDVVQEPIPKMRAMTLSGLCIFLDISHSTWHTYREKDDFLAVTKQVEEIIRKQKFEGAAVGFLNANIIARDLGLTEKSDVSLGGNGTPVATSLEVSFVEPEKEPDNE